MIYEVIGRQAEPSLACTQTLGLRPLNWYPLGLIVVWLIVSRAGVIGGNVPFRHLGGPSVRLFVSVYAGMGLHFEEVGGAPMYGTLVQQLNNEAKQVAMFAHV